jgi:hypothetical protein
MEREPKGRIPKGARYPLFFLGFAILVFGGLAANAVGAPIQVDVVLGVAGFVCLILSVGLR